MIITCIGNHPESNTFADDIVAVLKEGGWQASKQGVVTSLRPDEGLIFLAGDPHSKLGVILSNAFMSAGVDFVTVIDKGFQDTVRIHVGIKPKPKPKK